MKDFPTIQTPKQEKDFQRFIDDAENNKIIFSAKFGTGKTTFINNFFEQSKKYKIIKILPVNYSVASNEDIFELIKYDIILQLMEWDDIKEYIANISNVSSFQYKFMTSPMSIIAPIAKMISKINTKADASEKILGGLNALKTELDKYNEEKVINQFLKSIHKEAGNIFEHNIITSIICVIIDRFKEVNPDKEIVLVIDDLDRIDPEHIFRIMNVIAAHNTPIEKANNKFGFHKIILICDIINIENIFHTKYGINTDFNGYISKFHSRSVFHFSFADEISTMLDTIFCRVKCYNGNLTDDISAYKYNILKPVLILFIMNGELNIRRLSELPDAMSFDLEKRYPYTSRKIIENYREPLFILWYILQEIMNGKENVYKAINNCKRRSSNLLIIGRDGVQSDDSFCHLITEIICLLDRNNDSLNCPTNSKKYSIMGLDFYYKERAMTNNEKSYIIKIIKSDSELKFESDPIPVWDLLLEAFRLIEELEQKSIT
jgi:hypothetical protein